MDTAQTRREIVIDGDDFSTLDGFYNTAERLLTRDLPWTTGHNLSAFGDLLRGGFGVHEEYEPLAIRWIHAAKSRRDLGYEATAEYYCGLLQRCHPSNMERFSEKLAAARQQRGATLMDIIADIILETDTGHDCTLTFDDTEEPSYDDK